MSYNLLTTDELIRLKKKINKEITRLKELQFAATSIDTKKSIGEVINEKKLSLDQINKSLKPKTT